MRWLTERLAGWLTRLATGRFVRRGRRALARGDLSGAVAALQAALRLRPGCFEALLLLSRAYLRTRDVFRARSALVQARETDLTRFEASAAVAVALEGYDLAHLCLAPGAAASAVAVETAPRGPRRVQPGGGPPSGLPLGDCRDLDEYARFRAMPPIARGEITDWDEVISDLLDD